MTRPTLKLNTSLSDMSDHSSSTALTTPSPSPISPSPNILQKLGKRVLDGFGNVVEIGNRKFTINNERESGPLTVQKHFGLISPELDEPEVAQVLQTGVPLTRVTRRKRVTRVFSIEPENGIVHWDSKLSHKLHVDKIVEIRVGNDARNYRQGMKISVAHETQWASIVYNNESNKLKVLHIVGGNQHHFDLFITTLKRLVRYRQDLMSGLAMPEERFVNAHWNRLPKDETKQLGFDDVEKLTKKLHINCSKQFLLQKFNESDIDASGSLDFAEFQNFVRAMKKRDEIVQIFDQISGSNGALSLEGFRNFVVFTQGQEFDDNALKCFEKFAINGALTSESFCDILVSDFFSPIKECDDDMTRPLNEYFISSSHNTYLTGRQVADLSSVEAYVRALQNGCRCVEIDCWDGDSGPIVCHGRAFTTSLGFEEVVQTIQKYAFITSEYPLVVSLEVHCNASNQRKMVDILKTVLEGQLVVERLKRVSLTLPSPEELKHRILVKVKQATPKVEPTMDEFSGTETLYSSTDTVSSNTDSPKRKRKPPQTKIVPELAELGVYCSGIKFTNFSLPASKAVNHIFSFSERTFQNVVKHSGSDPIKKHNQQFLMRVYPSAYRVTSKNFDPIQYWKNGVQMVALNWQTKDVALQINDAMFDAHVGYAHKPFSLTNRHMLKFNHWLKKHYFYSIRKTPVKVSITVVSANQLPKPKGIREDRFEPSVSVEVYGGLSNESHNLSRTNSSSSSIHRIRKNSETSQPSMTPVRVMKTAAADNGFNPIWNETTEFTVDCINVPFVFMRFAVQVGESEFANYTMRLVNLRQGYRHLPLRDPQGEEYIFSRLFIKSDVIDE